MVVLNVNIQTKEKVPMRKIKIEVKLGDNENIYRECQKTKHVGKIK
jgi:hypothetical protein